MSDILATMQRASQARERGEYAEALRLHQALHAAPLPPPDERQEHSFRRFAFFEWGLLAREYPPARLAMHALREREAAQLGAEPELRFLYLVELNRHLPDPRHTLALFLQLESHAPALARRCFHHAADVLLECGAASVLQRYLPEPQEGTRYRAQYLNDVVRDCTAPRRYGETQAFVDDLRLQCGVLKLNGKPAAAEALAATALSLIDNEETRALARRELREPGTIAQLMADWREAQG